MDRVFVESIEFHGYHGASSEERLVGHRFSVDVELRIDLMAAAASDSLSDTVDYAMLARTVVDIGTTRRFQLVEALAGAITDAILADRRVDSVRVRIRKLRPPMDVIVENAGVELERHQHVPDTATG